MALLSREIVGVELALPDFPVLKGVRGLGMSDPEELAKRLAEKFDYTNTFYHQEPRLDIVNPAQEQLRRYDFILSSEVLEHVPQPVEHDLAIGLVQRVEGVEELFLETLFAFHELDVVDEQHVDLSVAPFEVAHHVGADGVDELVEEGLGGDVAHGEGRVVLVHVVGDGPDVLVLERALPGRHDRVHAEME